MIRDFYYKMTNSGLKSSGYFFINQTLSLMAVYATLGFFFQENPRLAIPAISLPISSVILHILLIKTGHISSLPRLLLETGIVLLFIPISFYNIFVILPSIAIYCSIYFFLKRSGAKSTDWHFILFFIILFLGLLLHSLIPGLKIQNDFSTLKVDWETLPLLGFFTAPGKLFPSYPNHMRSVFEVLYPSGFALLPLCFFSERNFIKFLYHFIISGLLIFFLLYPSGEYYFESVIYLALMSSFFLRTPSIYSSTFFISGALSLLISLLVVEIFRIFGWGDFSILGVLGIFLLLNFIFQPIMQKFHYARIPKQKQ